MKQIFTSIVLLLSYEVFPQSSVTNSLFGLYEWSEMISITPSNEKGIDANGQSPTLSIVGQSFRVVDTVDKHAIIFILNYDVDSPDFYKYNYQGTAKDYEDLDDTYKKADYFQGNQRYFKVPINKLKLAARKQLVIPASLAIGVINFPFKYRFQKNGDFSGAFNFGAGIGIKIEKSLYKRFQHSILSGYSISNINLDSASVRRNSSDLTSTNNFTAFSFSLGWMVEYERAQLGVFVGVDALSRINQVRYEWINHRKPWISVGFGFSIFSTEDPKEANTESN